MSFRGLESKIAFQILVLITIAMILVDIVMLSINRNNLVGATAENARLKIDLAESLLKRNEASMDSILKGLGKSQDRFYLLIKKNNQLEHFGSHENRDSDKFLHKHARLALDGSREIVETTGTTWGVFWRGRKNLVAARPVNLAIGQKASIAVAISLEPIYLNLRKSQKIIFIYIVLNAIILLVIGHYRLSKMYLRPVQRLAEKAEAHDDEDDIFFSARKQDNELSRLSNALNQMLKRISEDRRKLRKTVASLEKANKELKIAQNEVVLAEKLASVGRLSAGVAHEIGNPVGIVLGYLNLLKQDDFTDAEKNDFISRAEDEINRINTIIRRLLDITRPSMGDPEQISIHRLLSEVLDVFRLQPLASEMSITALYDAENDIIVADADPLRQVFVNILLNSIDAISSVGKGHPGKITVETHNSKASETKTRLINIAVEDNGVGIEADHAENVFDPFYTTKAPGKGTGLGLSVSFTIIEKMGGMIKVEKSRKSGARVVIQLPLSDRHDQPGAHP